ncbi:Flp1 family type IVb pilin [Bacilliculturomica massiliensis]|uniref:Flp1 family type IVb pilin n=1 Tax=Bacilliculturomica massiliensis TaxID=1917867 RepID=UPI0010324D91|nr:Flp1 family type IVb pilin [Bacilliculturomica massiliensis]
MKGLMKRFVKEEEGVAVVEMVLILAALVGIALIFKDQITSFVTDTLTKIFEDAKQ